MCSVFCELLLQTLYMCTSVWLCPPPYGEERYTRRKNINKNKYKNNNSDHLRGFLTLAAIPPLYILAASVVLTAAFISVATIACVATPVFEL